MGVTRPSGWARGWRVPAYTRFAPLESASVTSAWPMPRLAPVTSTVLSAIVMSVAPVLSCSCGLRAAWRPTDIDQPDSRESPWSGMRRGLGSAAARPGRGRRARLAAMESDELVAGGGWAGQPDQVGEQPRPGAWGDEQRGDRQQDGRQARRDRPVAAACERDIPAMDGDLDGSGHRDDARGQLAVPDGDPPPGSPRSRAGAQQPGVLSTP